MTNSSRVDEESAETGSGHSSVPIHRVTKGIWASDSSTVKHAERYLLSRALPRSTGESLGCKAGLQGTVSACDGSRTKFGSVSVTSGLEPKRQFCSAIKSTIPF